MKLVLSVDALTPQLTGIGRYTWELASRLPARVDAIRYLRNGQWVPDPAALVHPPQPTVRKPWSRRLWRSPRWLREANLRRVCNDALFHGPNYFLPPYAGTGVITVHDLSVFKYPETHPPERIHQFEREFKRSVAQAAHIITDSRATMQEVISFLGWPAERISTVPLGVSPAYAPQEPAILHPCLQRHGLADRGYTLCVSTLEPRKKIAELLWAYRALPANLRTRYPLILVGSDGWLNAGLHEAIAEATREGWLRYLGYVAEADLPLLYAAARLFVYPSIYEGFGLPVLEAMAAGTPVIAADRTSLPEVTQGAARLLDPDDQVALTQALEAGLTDATWQAQARAAGLAVAATYSWEHCADATLAVYRQVAGITRSSTHQTAN